MNSSVTDPVEAIRDLTGGTGVRVAFERLVADTFATALNVLDDGGAVAGIAPANRRNRPARLVRRKLGDPPRTGACARTHMPALLAMVAAGTVRP